MSRGRLLTHGRLPLPLLLHLAARASGAIGCQSDDLQCILGAPTAYGDNFVQLGFAVNTEEPFYSSTKDWSILGQVVHIHPDPADWVPPEGYVPDFSGGLVPKPGEYVQPTEYTLAWDDPDAVVEEVVPYEFPFPIQLAYLKGDDDDTAEGDAAAEEGSSAAAEEESEEEAKEEEEEEEHQMTVYIGNAVTVVVEENGTFTPQHINVRLGTTVTW